jgi:hypothetical protein
VLHTKGITEEEEKKRGGKRRVNPAMLSILHLNGKLLLDQWNKRFWKNFLVGLQIQSETLRVAL